MLVACNPQTNDGPANAAQDDGADVIDTNSAAALAAPMTAQQFADTAAAASDAY